MIVMRAFSFSWCGCASLLLLAVSLNQDVQAAFEQRVGVAQIDVTPDYPIRLSGFGGRRTESEGVTLRIWAKAVAFADEQLGPAILIAADNLCVPDAVTREVARRLSPKVGLRPERLTI